MRIEKIITKERRAELQRMKKAGDTQGILRWHFGVYVTYMRGVAGLTQAAAAHRAGLTRVHWSRIENGHDLPKKENLPAIADAIHVDVGSLYRRAGYALPDGLGIYDMKRAKRDVEVALLESTSLAEFLITMQLVWQEFQLQRVGHNQRRYVDPAYAQIIEHLYESFSMRQRIALAREILQHSPQGLVSVENDNPHRFFDHLDEWVAAINAENGDGREPA
jgi:transcriptional regulator with XRE-family HTH domain